MRTVEGLAPPAPPELRTRWRHRGYLTDEQLGWALPRAAGQWPDRVAVVDDEGRHTFAQLQRRADAVAGALLEAGVGPGETVTWSLPNGVDAVATAAAVWRIGAVSNPVVLIYRQHEFAFILDQLRPAAVVTVDEFRGRAYTGELDEALTAIGHEPRLRLVSGASRPGWRAIADLPAPDALDAAAQPAAADDPCLVLYTSGTTSAPKGVIHTSQTLSQEVRSMQREWALSWRDVMFMASPVTHITGILQGLLVPTTVGARSVLVDRWEPEASVDRIEAEGATYMAGATVFLQGVLEQYQKRGIAPSLRQFTCGGAAVPPHLIEQADQVGFTAYRAWGMTEFPTTTLASENDPQHRRARTDGHVAEAVECEAVDAERRPLPHGEEGELRVRGPERCVGYVDHALDAEVFDDEGWFYTGDVGVVDDGGYVTITGRVKDIINRGGEKFSAREIEDLLAAHPSVAEVAVLAVPGGRLGERVCAAIVARSGAELDPAALAGYLERQQIAKQKIPEEFRSVDELPRTASGKIQKFKLLEQWRPQEQP